MIAAARLRLRALSRFSRVGLAGLVVLGGVGVSAHAALRAIADHPAPALAGESPAAGFEAQDHFPGAALLYAEEPPPPQLAPPAAPSGATGTIALPNIAVPAVFDPTIHPAAPFSMAHASPLDRGRALECLTAAIYYEAASEPDAGQAAVAQVVLNRVRHPAFPHSVCGVVYQGSERPGCQFSFACDGAMARLPSRAGWARALRAAAAALNGHVEGEVGTATHYHTYAVTPAWNRQLIMTAAIGAHFFHRWAGWWGTPAAFNIPYLGGEPIPGPHAPVIAPTPLVAPAIALALPAPVHATALPVTAASAIQPAYAETSVAKAPAPDTSGSKLPDSPILDRWKDSGQPLR